MVQSLPLLDDGVAELSVLGGAIELVPGEGLDDIFDVIGLLFAEFGAGLDDDLIAGDAVVEFVVDQLVLVRVHVPLVLVVPVLRTHAHSHRLVRQPVLHHRPEQLLP